jgi:hypothetical protein
MTQSQDTHVRGPGFNAQHCKLKKEEEEERNNQYWIWSSSTIGPEVVQMDPQDVMRGN